MSLYLYKANLKLHCKWLSTRPGQVNLPFIITAGITPEILFAHFLISYKLLEKTFGNECNKLQIN